MISANYSSLLPSETQEEEIVLMDATAVCSAEGEIVTLGKPVSESLSLHCSTYYCMVIIYHLSNAWRWNAYCRFHWTEESTNGCQRYKCLLLTPSPTYWCKWLRTSTTVYLVKTGLSRLTSCNILLFNSWIINIFITFSVLTLVDRILWYMIKSNGSL